MEHCELSRRPICRAPVAIRRSGGACIDAFIQSWVVDVLHRAIIELILCDIYDRRDEGDKGYFRASRDKRFGRALEDVQAGARHSGIPFPSLYTIHTPYDLSADDRLTANGIKAALDSSNISSTWLFVRVFANIDFKCPRSVATETLRSRAASTTWRLQSMARATRASAGVNLNSDCRISGRGSGI
jgi:hypothetical protein